MTRTIRYRRWTATNSDDVVVNLGISEQEEQPYRDHITEVDRILTNYVQTLNSNTASMNTATSTVASAAFPKPKPAVTLEPTIRALFYGMNGFCGGGYFHSDWTKDIITKEHALEALNKLFKEHGAQVDRTLLYFPDNAQGRWARVFSFFKEGEEIVLESKKYRTVWVFRVSSHLRSMNSGDAVKIFLLEAKTRTMTEEAIQSRQESLRAINASQEQLEEDERIWRAWKATSEL